MTTSSSAKLKFNKSIISSPKDTISLKELLERLDVCRTIHVELVIFDFN